MTFLFIQFLPTGSRDEPDISAFNTVRMTGDFDNIAVMNQTIDYGVGNYSVSEDIRPFRKRLIGC